jgi:nucleotide-binding universal stress UspA family protein
LYANVVVGIKGLDIDRDATALANALTGPHDRLVLVHVRLIDGVLSRGESSVPSALEGAQSRCLLERERLSLAPQAEMASVAGTTIGPALHKIAEQRGADLIVVGGSHRSNGGTAFAGQDAQSVLRDAPCAATIAPSGYADAPTRIATIAVGYDGSRAGEVALAHAGMLAAKLGARLVVRHVVDPAAYGACRWAPGALEDHDALIVAARERLGDALGSARLEIVVGRVGEELAALSAQADLLVCGSRDRTAVTRTVMGSTGEYLARHAACPLVLTPASDDQLVAVWQDMADSAAA